MKLDNPTSFCLGMVVALIVFCFVLYFTPEQECNPNKEAETGLSVETQETGLADILVDHEKRLRTLESNKWGRHEHLDNVDHLNWPER